MLPKANRLKKTRDFELVFEKGKGFKENFLFLKASKNKKKVTRFGFVVSKKFSKKATLRNRIKRKLREIIRHKLKNIEKGFDGVLVVNPGLEPKDFWELEEITTKLLCKAKFLKQNKTQKPKTFS